MKNRFPILLMLLLAGDLAAVLLDIKWLTYIFKPSLLLALAIYAFLRLRKTTPKPNDRLLFAALGLSWLGDIILMFPNGFIMGLLAFLAAHLAYLFLFRADNTENLLKQPDRRIWAVVIIVVNSALIGGLYPFLGALFLPVVLYALVLTLMFLTTLNRWKKVSMRSFQLCFCGGLFFVVSDSLLAFNKFVQPFEFSPIAIMLTYVLAQWLIVEGYLEHRGV
jgi:uncharacterized membrane protein YhhN